MKHRQGNGVSKISSFPIKIENEGEKGFSPKPSCLRVKHFPFVSLSFYVSKGVTKFKNLKPKKSNGH